MILSWCILLFTSFVLLSILLSCCKVVSCCIFLFFFKTLFVPRFPYSVTGFLLYVQYLAGCRESNPSCCDRSQVCYQWATHIIFCSSAYFCPTAYFCPAVSFCPVVFCLRPSVLLHISVLLHPSVMLHHCVLLRPSVLLHSVHVLLSCCIFLSFFPAASFCPSATFYPLHPSFHIFESYCILLSSINPPFIHHFLQSSCFVSILSWNHLFSLYLVQLSMYQETSPTGLCSLIITFFHCFRILRMSVVCELCCKESKSEDIFNVIFLCQE